MKKLMITAAIVCAAAFAQAAAISWSFSETQAANPAHAKYNNVADISGMEIYVFTTATWTSLYDNGYSSEALKSALDHTTLPTKSVNNPGAANETWAFAVPIRATEDLSSLTKGMEYALTMVVVDGDKYQAIAATTQNAIAYDPKEASSVVEGKLNIGISNTPYTTTGFQTFTNVPEPTSGLLLLLGVAGLALRRRRV